MNCSELLFSPTARELYEAVKALPIVDYHCHLSPREIWEDRPFSDLGEIWLGGDHYKWRLMRQAGVPERQITGSSDWRGKFLQYARALDQAPGHPLADWSNRELSLFFGIDTRLTARNAADVYEAAGAVIRREKLSPRKLIERARVEVICTTDDPADDLAYHQKLREDPSFSVRVLPSFRTDNLLRFSRPDYREYLTRFAAAAGTEITDLASLCAAIENRLDFFVEQGCRLTDLGIPEFPARVAGEKEAAASFAALLAGKELSEDSQSALLGYLIVFLARLYRERDLVMQWHLSVVRNPNPRLFEALGPDCGADCVGDPIPAESLCRVLAAMERSGGLPAVLLYSLNPANATQLASIAGSFPGVRLGAAWWFCDHRRGIREQLEVIAEQSPIGTFPGMLTDSRSFLSYARHDYFRRILCDLLGRWVEEGECEMENALRLAKRLCYENAKEMTECL